MKKSSAEKRHAFRKDLEAIHITHLTSLDSMAKISRGGAMVQASSTGILLVISREELIPTQLRTNLSLDSLIGEHVVIALRELNIEVSGHVKRTRFLGKNGFEIGIDYTEDSPEYWRECLVDLLPQPGEIQE